MLNTKKRKLPDIITVWKSDGTTDAYGNPAYAAPKHFYARWQGRRRIFETADGRQIRSTNDIITDVDAGDFGDYMLRGEHDDATPPSESYQIQDIQYATTLSGKRPQYIYIV